LIPLGKPPRRAARRPAPKLPGAMSVRRVVVAVVAAAIVVAALAAAVWARSYQPLEFTGGASGVEAEGVARRYDAENDEDESVRGFELVSGASLVRNGFDLHNEGPFAVEVEGMPSESGPLAVVGLERGTGETVRTWERLEPFRPFTLEPDEVAWFVMRTRPGTCGGGRNVTIQRRRVSIRYRYLWFLKRAQELELPYELRLRCS
jgi:hypothetical protein